MCIYIVLLIYVYSDLTLSRIFKFLYIQIKMPADFLQWHESMCADFPTRFNNLFRSPMWSGVDEKHHGYLIMVSTSINCN